MDWSSFEHRCVRKNLITKNKDSKKSNLEPFWFFGYEDSNYWNFSHEVQNQNDIDNRKANEKLVKTVIHINNTVSVWVNCAFKRIIFLHATIIRIGVKVTKRTTPREAGSLLSSKSQYCCNISSDTKKAYNKHPNTWKNIR